MEDQKDTQQNPRIRNRRVHMANERTFLAWIRTSIAVISVGFLITRFAAWLRMNGVQEPAEPSGQLSRSMIVGVAMMVIGAIIAALAAWRYHVVNRDIEAGQVTADRGLVILVTVLVILLAAGMIGFMLYTGQ